jgi:hypothetical protein
MGGEHSYFTHLVFKSKNKSSSSYQDWRLVDVFDVGRFGFALRFVGFCGSFLSIHTYEVCKDRLNVRSCKACEDRLNVWFCVFVFFRRSIVVLCGQQ